LITAKNGKHNKSRDSDELRYQDGGSDSVGATAPRAGISGKSCTIKTKTFRIKSQHGSYYVVQTPGAGQACVRTVRRSQSPAHQRYDANPMAGVKPWNGKKNPVNASRHGGH